LLVLGYAVGTFARQLPSPVTREWASPELRAALEAYQRGQYNAAYQQFSTLAHAGNTDAQFYVGYLHDEVHLGMTQDYATALRWYRLAAAQGHPKARLRLGYAYEYGRGVTQDTAEAARWYQAAVAQGDAEAQAALSRVGDVQDLHVAIAAYERGDHTHAFALLTDLANERQIKTHEAAEQAARNRGDRVAFASRRRRDALYYEQLAKAQYWLGLLYERGEGVAQDSGTAAKWYEAAAKHGNPDAAFNLAILYEEGRGVAPDPKKAWDWYSAAAVRGHPKAAAARERFAESRSGAAIGVPPRSGRRSDPTRDTPPPSGTPGVAGFDAAVDAYARRRHAWAAEQFLPLAEAGNVDAQIYLGHLYDQGMGTVQRDLAQAIQWYRQAAEQGDAGAQYWLGWLYRSDRFDGQGRQLNDYAESLRWLTAAAEQGHPDAQLELGHAYREGRGVVRDDTQRSRWYQTSHKNKEGVSRLIQQPQCAAVAGLPVFAIVYAACNRGDEGETSRQLTVLAKQGNAQAQNWLGVLYFRGLPGAWPGTAPYPVTVSGDLFQAGARWIRAAAEQGEAAAQYNLGVVYEHGMGVPANATEARRWYQAAVRQKSPEAQTALERLGQ
jgi:hypothetical protein